MIRAENRSILKIEPDTFGVCRQEALYFPDDVVFPAPVEPELPDTNHSLNGTIFLFFSRSQAESIGLPTVGAVLAVVGGGLSMPVLRKRVGAVVSFFALPANLTGPEEIDMELT